MEQTELLIVHVTARARGCRRLLVGRCMHRRRRGRGLLVLATLEHDSSRDPAQSGRVDQRVVGDARRETRFPRCRDAKSSWAGEKQDQGARKGGQGLARPVYKIAGGWSELHCTVMRPSGKKEGAATGSGDLPRWNRLMEIELC